MIDRSSAIAVAGGAVAGGAVRWVVVETFPSADGGWPWAVFVVNVVGALLLGVVLTSTAHRTDDDTDDRVRLGAGTGFCGALTTFSTFAVDVAGFARAGDEALGAGYFVVSLSVGVAAFLVGRSLVRTVAGDLR